jgi:hypothetical protein
LVRQNKNYVLQTPKIIAVCESQKKYLMYFNFCFQGRNTFMYWKQDRCGITLYDTGLAMTRDESDGVTPKVTQKRKE